MNRAAFLLDSRHLEAQRPKRTFGNGKKQKLALPTIYRRLWLPWSCHTLSSKVRIHFAQEIGQLTEMSAAFRIERALVGFGLTVVTIAAWFYLAHLTNQMSGMEGMPMPASTSWDTVEVVWTFVMWIVMMIAMMVPTAAPMILIFTTASRRENGAAVALVSTWIFVFGYLVAWTGFSLVAAISQWALQSMMLLRPETLKVSPFLGGALLIAAGIYEVTPFKFVCLSHCQSPLGFLLSEWRNGYHGAFLMGLRQGAFCIGCCWLLMTLLFAVGIMNLVWVIAIAVFALAEKLVHGRLVSYFGSVLFIIWGTLVILAHL